MEDLNIEELATTIAEKLNDIKTAEREKVVVQNKLDILSEEVDGLKERLNRLDATITSKKYEISNKLADTSSLFLIKKGE